MRIFGAHNQTQNILAKLGLRDGEKIAHPWISTALAKAQQKVEGRNFDVRKNLLKFDNIMNDQRKVIYEQRREIMSATHVTDTIRDLRVDMIHTLVSKAIPAHSYVEQWDLAGLQERVKEIMALDLPIVAWGQENGIAEEEIEARLKKISEETRMQKLSILDQDAVRRAEKAALLGVLDQSWKDHLLALDHLRQGIHLRGYGQRDPLNEYSREAFGLFHLMLNDIREQVTKTLMHSEMRLPSLEDLMARRAAALQELQHAAPPDMSAMPQNADPLPDGMVAHPAFGRKNRPGLPQGPVKHAFDQNDPSTWGDTPRNAACPCGSGKKYKHCHGVTA
jgi:preprotein translocase subunit SecA